MELQAWANYQELTNIMLSKSKVKGGDCGNGGGEKHGGFQSEQEKRSGVKYSTKEVT